MDASYNEMDANMYNQYMYKVCVVIWLDVTEINI